MRSALGLRSHLLEQRLNPLEPFVAFNREMERLAIKGRVAGVEECDDRTRLAEVAPRRLEHIGLTPRLLRRRRRSFAGLAKGHAAAGNRLRCWIFGRILRRHFALPSSAARVSSVCSAYSRANCSC